MHFPAFLTVLSAATVAAVPQANTKTHPEHARVTDKIAPQVNEPSSWSAFFGLTANLTTNKCVGAYGNICNKPGADAPVLGDYNPRTGKCVKSPGWDGPAQVGHFCGNMTAAMFYETTNFSYAPDGKAQAGEVYLSTPNIKGHSGLPVGHRPGCFAGLSWRKQQWFPQPSDCMFAGGVPSAEAVNGVQTVIPEVGV